MLVKWTRTALLNLDNAIAYIASDRPMAAKKAGQKIWDSAKTLAEHPGLGRPGRVAICPLTKWCRSLVPNYQRTL